MHRALRAIFAVFFLCLLAHADTQCFSNSNTPGSDPYPACCPKPFSAGIASARDKTFIYHCNRYLDQKPLQEPTYDQHNPQQCANLCASISTCAATTWVNEHRQRCYLYSKSPFNDEDAVMEYESNRVTMLKTEDGFGTPSPPPPPVDCQSEVDAAVSECNRQRDEYKKERDDCTREKTDCKRDRDEYKREWDECKAKHQQCEREHNDCKKERGDCEEQHEKCKDQIKNCPEQPDKANDALVTKDLCPEFDDHEFYLPTPGGGKTKWRVYCHHELVSFPREAQGYMNSTETPYGTLLASRHWDRGYRALSWVDDRYRHGTLYNLKANEAQDMQKRIKIYHVPNSSQNVIMRVDDMPFIVD